MSAALHNAALLTAASTVWYAAAVTIAAVTAVAARSVERRRDAREVLKVLVRRNPRRPPCRRVLAQSWSALQEPRQ